MDEKAKGMLPHKIGATIISRFRGRYKFLSNFYEAEFEYEGIWYKTVEHAYQERKATTEEYRQKIRIAPNAMSAARLGRSKSCPLRTDWLDIKGDVMRPIVEAKFSQNPYLMKMLLDTGDAYLVEGNYWHDNYFGSCSCKECQEKEQPLNMLGRILMGIRSGLTNTETANLQPTDTSASNGQQKGGDEMTKKVKENSKILCPECGREVKYLNEHYIDSVIPQECFGWSCPKPKEQPTVAQEQPYNNTASWDESNDAPMKEQQPTPEPEWAIPASWCNRGFCGPNLPMATNGCKHIDNEKRICSVQYCPIKDKIGAELQALRQQVADLKAEVERLRKERDERIRKYLNNPNNEGSDYE